MESSQVCDRRLAPHLRWDACHAPRAATRTLRIKSWGLLFVLAVGLAPGTTPVGTGTNRSMEDALLLALGSHEHLDIGRSLASASGGGRLLGLVPLAAGGRKNPHAQMASWYEDMAMALDGQNDPLYDYALEKIEEHNRLADELDRARARRANRGRGFQRFVRGVARVSGNAVRAVGIGVKETVRFATTVVVMAVEDAPRLARQYVERKVREAGALLQGRIDLAWDKIADRVGLPFAIWLRQRVDRAFVRHRDRLLARLQGDPGQTRSPATTQLERESAAFEKAGAMVASCEYRELTDPAYAGTSLSSIPFEIRLDLKRETFSYHIEAEAYYEDYQKCNVTVSVDGVGILAGEEGWFQGEETMASLASCYILNTQSGEKYYAEPREGGWTREIAGFAVPSPWTVHWCPVGPMGDVNAMMRAGKEALMASGHCQACSVTMPE